MSVLYYKDMIYSKYNKVQSSNNIVVANKTVASLINIYFNLSIVSMWCKNMKT